MTPPPAGDNPWERLAAAARQRGATRSVEPAIEPPPPGFAARLAAKWADLRQNEVFRLWCRWSLLAALAGIVIAGIVLLWPAPKPASPNHPLSVPGVDAPSLSSR